MKYEKPELIIDLFEREICTTESSVVVPKGAEFIDKTGIQQDQVSYMVQFTY